MSQQDEPGRRTRARQPTPRMSVRCPCGRPLLDVTDLADPSHPRWDATMRHAGDERYAVSVRTRIPLRDRRGLGPGIHRYRDPGSGLWGQTWEVPCRCGKNHQYRHGTLARAWRQNMRPGIMRVTLTAGRDI